MHLRTHDLVDLPLEELSDKYRSGAGDGQYTHRHPQHPYELPVRGSYRLVSEADCARSTMPIEEEGEAQGADIESATGAGCGGRPVLNNKLQRQYGK